MNLPSYENECTILIIRILTNDDPVQAKRAAKAFGSDAVFIPKTINYKEFK
jgi:hypothetical protein